MVAMMPPEVSTPKITTKLITWRWLLVAPALLLWWVIGQISKTNVSLIIADPLFLKELHLSGTDTALGGLMSAFFFGYGISIFVWGFLVDRFGPRLCAIAGALGGSVLIFLSSRVGNINEYLLLRFLLGFAEGNLWPVSNALTNLWFPVREHSRAQAFWITGVTLGTAAGVPIVTVLILATGWRESLFFLSILSLLPIATFWFVMDQPHEQKGISTKELNEIESDRRMALSLSRLDFRESLTSIPFWLIMICQLVAATTVYTMIQWIPTYLTAFRHVPFRSMGAWITIGYVIATILTLVVGYVGDRTMQRTLTGAWACLIFAVLVIPAALILPPAGSAVALSALISVPASIAALNGALIHTLVRPGAIARSTGVYVGIANVVSALGPLAFGGLINSLGGKFWGGFLFLAVLDAIAAACYLTLYHLSTRRVQMLVPTPE
jgi:sugar phosphate permease